MRRIVKWRKNRKDHDESASCSYGSMLSFLSCIFRYDNGDREQKFYDEDGRRYFMLYLRPIINGEGNYYMESKTRNSERTDMIIDYRGKTLIEAVV